MELLFGPAGTPFTWERTTKGFGNEVKRARRAMVEWFASESEEWKDRD